MFNLYNQIQANPVAKIQYGDITFGHLLSALYAGAVSHSTGIDNRGLWNQDRRYAEASGYPFINGAPTAPPHVIIDNYKWAATAVSKRSKKSKKMTVTQYIYNLVVRSIRAQILNPILRQTRWLKIGSMAERLRTVAFHNHKFMKMAINPINAVYFQQWVLNG